MADRKSILVVGVGSIGERHLRCFLTTGRANVLFCEVNSALRNTVAERYSTAKALPDIDAALSQKPDGAIICTPAHLHIPLALTATKAGVNLLVEKPLSTKLDGVETLLKEIIQRNLVAGVAYVYRSHPALIAMREAILTGRFGKPLQIVGTFGQNFPFYRPGYRETYYRDHKSGGGAVQDALTHIINMGEWLVGPVDKLAADAAHQSLEGVEVEDTVHVITRHGSVLGSFSLNQYQVPNEGFLTVVCQNGTVRFETHNHHWCWQTDPAGRWQIEPAAKLERDTLFTRQAVNFLDALDGLNPLSCSLEEGIQTLRVNLAILRAIEERNWQTL